MMKVLVANRGEIAVRILRACREMGLPSVAVYTDVDCKALHVRCADEAVAIGPRQAYLDIEAILSAARRTGATAIHPGYGFLAENADFARAVEEAGLIFLGPRPETIALTGDKLASRRAAREAGLPILPGTEDPLPAELSLYDDLLASVTFPVLVKATAGGGGRGIRLATCAEELPEMVAAARAEALAAFGDDTVYLESLVPQARHIEVQILGDGQGNILCLGERECSIQRRRQKLIEEAPAPGLSSAQRAQLYEMAYRLGHALQYRGLGTVEFLLDANQRFYFIEINPRVQVEHPVTEMVTGLDLIRQQLRLALGEPLTLCQEEVTLRGAAIEARILAEDASQGFLPATGEITYLKEPGGPGVRVDSALYQGLVVSADYDSLLAKLIVWAEDRPAAIARLRRALGEFQIGGVPTDIEFLTQIIASQPFISGNVHTTYLENFQPQPARPHPDLLREIALAAALYAHKDSGGDGHAAAPASYWQMIAWREQLRAGG